MTPALVVALLFALAGALLVDLALRVPDELPAAKRSRPLLILLTGVRLSCALRLRGKSCIGKSCRGF